MTLKYYNGVTVLRTESMNSDRNIMNFNRCYTFIWIRLLDVQCSYYRMNIFCVYVYSHSHSRTLILYVAIIISHPFHVVGLIVSRASLSFGMRSKWMRSDIENPPWALECDWLKRMFSAICQSIGWSFDRRSNNAAQQWNDVGLHQKVKIKTLLPSRNAKELFETHFF